jgi:hypothetical protein
MIEGSGSGRPKNIWILRIRSRLRIRNTAWQHVIIVSNKETTQQCFCSIVDLDPDPLVRGTALDPAIIVSNKETMQCNSVFCMWFA